MFTGRRGFIFAAELLLILAGIAIGVVYSPALGFSVWAICMAFVIVAQAVTMKQ